MTKMRAMSPQEACGAAIDGRTPDPRNKDDRKPSGTTGSFPDRRRQPRQHPISTLARIAPDFALHGEGRWRRPFELHELSLDHSRGRINKRRLGEIRNILDECDFRPEDVVIAGSARLWVQNSISTLRDIDIVAKSKAFDHAFRLTDMPHHGGPTRGSITRDRIAQLFQGRVNVSSRWIHEDENAEYLICRAEVIDGIQFMRPTDVLSYKKELDRPKDRALLKGLQLSCR